MKKVNPVVGYLVTSHVIYQHLPIVRCLTSMLHCGIPMDRIVVAVNGSGERHEMVCNGVRFFFRTGEAASHFQALVDPYDMGRIMGITHWFHINGTSYCGQHFRHLVESHFNPEADCTAAGNLLPIGKYGDTGRLINDLGMYRNDYIQSKKEYIMSLSDFRTQDAIEHVEGSLFAMAPRKAYYPLLHHADSEPKDIYGTGTMRITEYYPGVDWYRYKKNWGQLRAGEYKMATV